MSTGSPYPTTATSGDANWTITESSRVPTTLFRFWYPAIFVWMELIAVIGVPGNIVVLKAYAKFPSLHNPTNFLIANQSVADLISYGAGQIVVVFSYSLWGLNLTSTNKYACLFPLCSLTLALLSSVINLLALSVERLLAVAFPFQYLRWVTDTSVKRVVIVLWVIHVMTASLPVLGWNTWIKGRICIAKLAFPYVYFIYIFIMPVFLVLILIAIVNIFVSVVAVTIKRKVAPLKPSTETMKEGEQTPRGDYKITKMFLMVVGVFYLSWLPYTVITIMFFAQPESWKKNGIPELTWALHDMSKGLLLFNAAVNPCIYYKTNSGFRNAFRKLFGWTPLRTDNNDSVVRCKNDSIKTELSITHIYA